MATLLKGYKLFYSPSGRAGEYANHGYACNLYNGCVHGCRYCYVPACKRTTTLKFHAGVTPQKDVLKRVAHDAAQAVLTEPVFLSFSCDPYPPGEINALTREAVKIILESGNRVNILTKGGLRAARDFDLLASVPGNKLGATLTFYDSDKSLEWEPRAALPYERMQMLNRAKALGIYTWVSMEPVINPGQTLELIQTTAGYVDEYRIGKWNHSAEASKINWQEFRWKAEMLCKQLGLNYIIKKDLLEAR